MIRSAFIGPKQERVLDSKNGALPFSLKKRTPALGGTRLPNLSIGATKPYIVVAVVGVVVVAIGAPAVRCIIDPRAAAQGFRTRPYDFKSMRLLRTPYFPTILFSMQSCRRVSHGRSSFGWRPGLFPAQSSPSVIHGHLPYFFPVSLHPGFPDAHVARIYPVA